MDLQRRSQQALALAITVLLAVPAFVFTMPVYAATGDLTLTVLADPAGLEEDGEYITLSYSGDGSIDLTDWEIADNSGRIHVIGAFSIDSGTTYTACRNGDNTLNGGLGCDEDWGAEALGNASEIIIVTDAGAQVVVELPEFNAAEGVENSVTVPFTDETSGEPAFTVADVETQVTADDPNDSGTISISFEVTAVTGDLQFAMNDVNNVVPSDDIALTISGTDSTIATALFAQITGSATYDSGIWTVTEGTTATFAVDVVFTAVDAADNGTYRVTLDAVAGEVIDQTSEGLVLIFGATDDGADTGTSTDDGTGTTTNDGSETGTTTDDGTGTTTDDGSDTGSSTDDGTGTTTDDGADTGTSTDDGTGTTTNDGSETGTTTDDGTGTTTDDGSDTGSSTDDPADPCEFEGHKYDTEGNPLAGWQMGLIKVIQYEGQEYIHTISTDVTDADGSYCLRWSTDWTPAYDASLYPNGYTFEYRVYETNQADWEFNSVERGPAGTTPVEATLDFITFTGEQVQVMVGETDGYVIADAEYHVDFYNRYTGTTTSNGTTTESGSTDTAGGSGSSGSSNNSSGSISGSSSGGSSGGTRVNNDDAVDSASGQPTVAGITDSADTPEPLVLGEQVAAVPLGGANTGAGGSAPTTPVAGAIIVAARGSSGDTTSRTQCLRQLQTKIFAQKVRLSRVLFVCIVVVALLGELVHTPAHGALAGPRPGTTTPAGQRTVAAASSTLPHLVHIPTLEVSARFGPALGLRANGEVQVPTVYEQVGWYKHSPVPGELGPAVILGHVDSREGPAVFYGLGQLKPGDEIVVERNDGVGLVFEVTMSERYQQDSFPTELVYGDIDHAGLRLVTCSGWYDRDTDRYSHNRVVFAKLKQG